MWEWYREIVILSNLQNVHPTYQILLILQTRMIQFLLLLVEQLHKSINSLVTYNMNLGTLVPNSRLKIFANKFTPYCRTHSVVQSYSCMHQCCAPYNITHNVVDYDFTCRCENFSLMGEGFMFYRGLRIYWRLPVPYFWMLKKTQFY